MTRHTPTNNLEAVFTAATAGMTRNRKPGLQALDARLWSEESTLPEPLSQPRIRHPTSCTGVSVRLIQM